MSSPDEAAPISDKESKIPFLAQRSQYNGQSAVWQHVGFRSSGASLKTRSLRSLDVCLSWALPLDHRLDYVEGCVKLSRCGELAHDSRAFANVEMLGAVRLDRLA